MDRRRYLRTVAIAGATAAVAGCTDGSGDGSDPTDSPRSTPTDGGETPTETETPAPTPTATDEPGEPTATTPTDADQRVAVVDFAFDPGSFEVSVGDTVLWVWEGSGHNLKYDDGAVPEDSDWEGTAGSRTDTYGEGHTHSHTFEAAGEYDYYCVPHRTSGMTGSFTVTE